MRSVREEKRAQRVAEDDGEEEPDVERHRDQHQRVVQDNRRRSEHRADQVLLEVCFVGRKKVPRKGRDRVLFSLRRRGRRHKHGLTRPVLLEARAEALDEVCGDAEEDNEEKEPHVPRVRARHPVTEQDVVGEARVEVHLHDADAEVAVVGAEDEGVSVGVAADVIEALGELSAHVVPPRTVLHVVVEAYAGQGVERVLAVLGVVGVSAFHTPLHARMHNAELDDVERRLRRGDHVGHGALRALRHSCPLNVAELPVFQTEIVELGI
mmetsp:Transcript_27264/g.54861  ORF Transcript_27264/g.54861 Transcript_27264/m.54861 type:complete len:267 (+) Transcript_27264:388-1188(+)